MELHLQAAAGMDGEGAGRAGLGWADAALAAMAALGSCQLLHKALEGSGH